MNQEGIFIFKGKPYRYRWEKKEFRLEPATYLPGTFKVPVDLKTMFTPNRFQDVSLLVGQRGDGRTVFFDWLGGPKSKWRRCNINDFDDIINQALSKKRKKGLHLFLDLSRESFEDEKSRDILAKVAGFIEGPAWRKDKDRLICYTNDVAHLQKNLVYSTILSRGHAFRLPHFTHVELLEWFGVLQKKHPRLKLPEDLEPLAKRIFYWVGGQPSLTHFFFYLLEQAPEVNFSSNIESLIENIGEQILQDKPNIVNRWLENLKPLLKYPSLRSRLESYVEGNTIPIDSQQFTQDDVQLYLLGWVAERPDGCWGMRSKCHQEWAIDALGGNE